MEIMNKTIKKEMTIMAPLLLSFCFVHPGTLIYEDSISYNIEKNMKHVNAGGFDVMDVQGTSYYLRFTDGITLLGGGK